jgi:NAD+ diphosphatase
VHYDNPTPVVAAVVEHEGQVLLARNKAWPDTWYALVAGFLEREEDPVAAVAREVLEESGVRIGPPRYVSSQPWPFPASLMLGFVAPWESGEPRIGDEELEDVRWFSRKAVEDAIGDRGTLRLPPPLAIARRLIDGWLET